MRYKKHTLASTLGLLALFLLVPQLLAIQLPEMPESEWLLCYPTFYDEEAPSDQYETEASIISYFEQSLLGSDNVDGQVLYSAILAAEFKDRPQGIETLASLTADNPQNDFAALHLLNACLKNTTHQACINQRAVEQAISQNEDDALLWSLVASLRYAQDDIDGAIQALEIAGIAPIYDDYFRRHVEIISGALPTLDKYWNNILPGRMISIAVSVGFDNLQSVIEICAEHAGQMPLLANACMNFGSRVEQQSSYMLSSMLAGAIQTVTYRALGDIDEYNRREREYIQQSQARVAELQNSGYYEALSLMSYDEQLAEYWLQNLIQFGEVTATENMVEEAKRLSRDPEYKPCDAPSLRFEFPFFYVGDKHVTY